jgi:uncharacterized membrane protein (UPF0127 family)
MISVTSLKNHKVIADKCYVAESFLDRLRGLIGKSGMNSGEGMFFPRCNDIHMWFMRIPIDVVFVRPATGDQGHSYVAGEVRTYEVTRVCESLKPWKLLPVRNGRATETIELPVGTIQGCDICLGDRICIS